MRGLAGVRQQIGTLAKIIENQRRQHEPQPGHSNRHNAKVTHVRIECLATGHGQHNRPQRDKRQPMVTGKEM